MNLTFQIDDDSSKRFCFKHSDFLEVRIVNLYFVDWDWWSVSWSKLMSRKWIHSSKSLLHLTLTYETRHNILATKWDYFGIAKFCTIICHDCYTFYIKFILIASITSINVVETKPYVKIKKNKWSSWGLKPEDSSYQFMIVSSARTESVNDVHCAPHHQRANSYQKHDSYSEYP